MYEAPKLPRKAWSRATLVRSARLLLLSSGAASFGMASDFPSWTEKDLRVIQHEFPQGKVGNGVTRFVYLHPTDRPIREDYEIAMEWSASTLQSWYTSQLDGAYAFQLPSPIVRTVALDHAANYYGSNNATSDGYLTFWNNVLREAMPKAGATFNDPLNVWIFFVDAPAGCNQLSGGGTSGIVVMSHNDLRGLVGEGFLDCNNDEDPGLTFTPQRWIGGQGHELGHAFGLPHPPGCDNGQPDCDSDALMWTGFYGGFPDDTYLRQDEKPLLIAGPYFKPLENDFVFGSGFED